MGKKLYKVSSANFKSAKMGEWNNHDYDLFDFVFAMYKSQKIYYSDFTSEKFIRMANYKSESNSTHDEYKLRFESDMNVLYKRILQLVSRGKVEIETSKSYAQGFKLSTEFRRELAEYDGLYDELLRQQYINQDREVKQKNRLKIINSITILIAIVGFLLQAIVSLKEMFFDNSIKKVDIEKLDSSIDKTNSILTNIELNLSGLKLIEDTNKVIRSNPKK